VTRPKTAKLKKDIITIFFLVFILLLLVFPRSGKCFGVGGYSENLRMPRELRRRLVQKPVEQQQ
jgi:hypothetical protein